MDAVDVMDWIGKLRDENLVGDEPPGEVTCEGGVSIKSIGAGVGE